LNPEEFFRHCKHLHIAYLGQSITGQSIGIPSMGPKLIWCKYGGVAESYSLQFLFDGFKEDHCKNCPHQEKREKDWICTVKMVKDQMEEEEFQEILRKIREFG